MELVESEHESGAIWICKRTLWPRLQSAVAARGARAVALGTPYQGRVIFRVVKPTQPR